MTTVSPVTQHVPSPAVMNLSIGAEGLPGELTLPPGPTGVVVSAAGRDEPPQAACHAALAQAMMQHGLATLIFDPLTPAEKHGRQRVLDMALLASRIRLALHWLRQCDLVAGLPVGLYGTSQGASAALLAAAREPQRINAVVTQGGRPDLAGAQLSHVRMPTLLLMGNDDIGILELTRHAARALPGTTRMSVMPPAPRNGQGVTAPGAAAASAAGLWFAQHLPAA
jgi:pimeloyl-ACP methyl ester carboxylesterase